MKITTAKYYIPSGRCVQALDYSKRNADGSIARTPDSLTNVFHTAAGREVRDGGGIRPDIEIKLDKTPNILFYLMNEDMIFDYATQNDIVSKNYAKFIKIEEKIEKTGSIFTDEEIQTLWKHSEEPIARMLLILIYTGMRIGELLQMNKDTIHLDECYMVGGSKTEAGKDRVIPIHNDILPLVKMQLGDNKWLYQTSKGNPTNYSNLSPVANKYMLKLGMNHKFHDARKTAISLMHTAGIPMETIKIIVGHAGTDVTEKVYLYKNIHELVETVNRMKIKK
jgi:integrase